MPERNPFEETLRAGRQVDTRFGGNLERANTRRPPSSSLDFPPDRNIGGTNAPKSVGFPVIENLGSSNLEKLMSMRDPKGLAYNFTNMLSNAYPGTYNEFGDYTANKYDPYAYTTSGNFSYQGAEMGEPGAIITNQKEMDAARARGDKYIPEAVWKKPTFNKLGRALFETATTGTYDDEGRFTMDAFLGTEKGKGSEPVDMFTGIPTTLTKENIPGIEASLDELRSEIYGDPGPSGSWDEDYGENYAALYGAGIGAGPKQLGPPEDVPRGLEMLDYMVRLHKDNPYTRLAMARDGGIMNLRK